jgi:PqqD family protein of HPr-rel-A system
VSTDLFASAWGPVAREILERWWGDEAVVFDTYSGATHYLDGLTTAIWSTLRKDGPATISELRARLAEQHHVPLDNDTIPLVIGELVELKLVERREF